MTLDHEVDVLEHQFARNSVKVMRGAARFLEPHRIEVVGDDGEHHAFTADKAFIAVGTRPYRPAHVPFDGERVFDSDEILDLQRLPRSLTVVGAGVIGVEYATIFSALVVPVTLVEARSSMLDFIDRELIEEFVHELRDRGMTIRLGQAVEGIACEDGAPAVTLDGGRRIRSDMLLYAAGRVGAVGDLGLDAIGVEADQRGRVKVDALTLQTTVPNVYAGGDVIGFPSLASTSMEQGRIAACHAFGAHAPAPPEFFPYGVYSVPEISTVGMSEQEVREKGIPYECGVARFRETSRGHIMGLNTGHDEDDLLDQDPPAARRAYRRRGRDRADPHRPGGAEPEGHHRLLHREHLQLPDPGRGLQDRRPGRLEPPAQPPRRRAGGGGGRGVGASYPPSPSALCRGSLLPPALRPDVGVRGLRRQGPSAQAEGDGLVWETSTPPAAPVCRGA
ncbi:MAG: FAD-dependent oxidoreductase [Caulobacteraceae bacterium]